MVAGHLQEKKGYFYMVLSYPDAAGKRKTKWLPTGLFSPEFSPFSPSSLFFAFFEPFLKPIRTHGFLPLFAAFSSDFTCK